MSEDRSGSQLCRHEGFVDAVPGERIYEPGRIADEEDAITGSARSRLSHRKAMTANVRQRIGPETVLARQSLEVTAQIRPLVEPAPHSQVRVIALREHPPVPAGNDAELNPRRRLVRVGIEAAPRN